MAAFIQAISIASLQVHYYSEALLTQHGYCAGFSRHAQPKSLLNIKNVARQDALNASLYDLDRNQSTLSRHVQNIVQSASE